MLNTIAQNTIFSFFGPILVEMGYTAGQGLPPAELATFAVAGVVGGLLGFIPRLS